MLGLYIIPILTLSIYYVHCTHLHYVVAHTCVLDALFRIATLINLKKALAEINVPLLVISYGASASDSASAAGTDAAQCCPLVELWRCIGATTTTTTASTTTTATTIAATTVEESNINNISNNSSTSTSNTKHTTVYHPITLERASHGMNNRIAAVFTDRSDLSLIYSHYYQSIAQHSFLNCPIVAINSNFYEMECEETGNKDTSAEEINCWNLLKIIQVSKTSNIY